MHISIVHIRRSLSTRAMLAEYCGSNANLVTEINRDGYITGARVVLYTSGECENATVMSHWIIKGKFNFRLLYRGMHGFFFPSRFMQPRVCFYFANKCNEHDTREFRWKNNSRFTSRQFFFFLFGVLLSQVNYVHWKTLQSFCRNGLLDRSRRLDLLATGPVTCYIDILHLFIRKNSYKILFIQKLIYNDQF